MSRAFRRRIWHRIATWLYRIAMGVFVVAVLPVVSLAALVDEMEDEDGGECA